MDATLPAPATQLMTDTAPVQNRSDGSVHPLTYLFHLASSFVSSQFTIGLAKIFNLEVLPHGTSIESAHSILMRGADPSKGGHDSGSTVIAAEMANDLFGATNAEVENDNKKVIDNTKGYFYVFKDSESPRSGIEKFFMPSIHKILSGMSAAMKTANKVFRIIQQVFLGIANFFLSPTLRFMVRPEELDQFEEDPDYGDSAYRTKLALPTEKIGLVGVCGQASLDSLRQAWETRPERVWEGIGQLFVGTLLTITGLGLLV